MANRKELETGYKLELYNKADESAEKAGVYTIDKLIGRGGSCLVYNAKYWDNAGNEHDVRVKECYPFWINMERDKRELKCEIEEQFKEEKSKFQDAYNKYVNIRKGELMNSLVDALEIGYANNTVYYVMAYSEGESYSKWEEKNRVNPDRRKSLKDFFEMVDQISAVIEKIHNENILYLDLKPENIWVEKGTQSIVKLFDFDTSIDLKDIREMSEKINEIAYSQGYAAPEMIWEEVDDWGSWTDIYSIGVLVYKRLYDQLPKPMVGTWGYKFDYENLKESYPSIQPKFFTALDEFLHKTLAVATYDRYQKMDEVRKKLKFIINILNEEIFVRGNYSVETDLDIKEFFVGREKELQEIDEYFEKGNHVVILSGMGGIGKTKLAKRYAYDGVKRGEYSRVTFMTYNKKIENMICSEEMEDTLNAFEKDERDSKSAYCKKKLKKLKELWGKGDLVILDNVDCEDDEIIGEFSSDKYNLLVTSRISFDSQIGYTVKVDGFDPEGNECLEIFKKYCEERYDNYEPQEIEAVKRIINYYNGHTYLIVLLAKMLEKSCKKPLEVEKRVIIEEGGMKSISLKIDARKDGGKREKKTISEHIKKLFDLSQFSEREEELLRVICIFGENQINIRLLVDWFSEDIENDINELADKGWIEINEGYDFIKMHPLMAEVMYDKLGPTTNNCELVTRKMIEVMERLRWYDYDDKEICTYFYRKIKGHGELYCQLAITYCRYVDNNLDTINEIIRKCEEKDYHAGLAEIYLLKVEKLFEEIVNDRGDKKKNFADMTKSIEKAVEEKKEKDFLQEVVDRVIGIHIYYENTIPYWYDRKDTIRLVRDFSEDFFIKIEKIYRELDISREKLSELHKYIEEIHLRENQLLGSKGGRLHRGVGGMEKYKKDEDALDEMYEAIYDEDVIDEMYDEDDDWFKVFIELMEFDENDLDTDSTNNKSVMETERSYCILKKWERGSSILAEYEDSEMSENRKVCEYMEDIDMKTNELTTEDITNLFDVLKMEYVCKRIDIGDVKNVIETIQKWYDFVKQDDKNAFKYCMYKFLMDEGKDFNEVCDKVYVECEQMTRDIISGLIFSEEDKGKSKEKLEDLKNMAEKAGSEKVMEKCEKYSAINSQFILAEKK